MKKRGFTLVEVLVYISILVILFSIVTGSIKNKKQQQDFAIQKRNISQFIRKIQKYSQENKKEYILDFRISENKVYFIDENSGEKEIIDKMEISPNLSYMTNNSEKNKDFIRKTTLDGNFEKGFSIFLLNKEGNKIFYRISTNTITAIKYPIISIYKAKKPININEEYLKTHLWEVEL